MLIPSWTTERLWKKYIRTTPQYLGVFERYNYSCADCSSDSSALIIHHIDHSRKNGKLNDSFDNLVVLCRKCHARRHEHNISDSRDKIVSLLQMYSISNTLYHGSLQKVADSFGISRERVRQVAKMSGFIMPRSEENGFYNLICNNCGKGFHSRTRNKTCCSTPCYKEHNRRRYWTTKKCKNCIKDFHVLKSRISIGREPTFCSKKCQGKYIGKMYGFRKVVSQQ